jgi:hypothetical protein
MQHLQCSFHHRLELLVMVLAKRSLLRRRSVDRMRWFSKGGDQFPYANHRMGNCFWLFGSKSTWDTPKVSIIFISFLSTFVRLVEPSQLSKSAKTKTTIEPPYGETISCFCSKSSNGKPQTALQLAPSSNVLAW